MKITEYFMARGLKIKLLIVQLFGILPFLIFVFYLFDLWYDTSRLLVIQENTTQARTVSEMLLQTIQTGRSFSHIISENETVRHPDPEHPEKIQTFVNEIARTFPQISGVFITDEYSTVVANSFSGSKDNERKATTIRQEYTNKSLTNQFQAVSDPILWPLDTQRSIMIVTPIRVSGEVKSVMNINYTIDYLKGISENAMIGETRKTLFIVDGKGNLIFTIGKPLPEDISNKLFSQWTPLKDIRNGKAVIIENDVLPTLNDKMIGIGIPVLSTDWTVISVQPVQDVYAPLFNLQKRIWILIPLALFFTFSLFTYFLRKVRLFF